MTQLEIDLAVARQAFTQFLSTLEAEARSVPQMRERLPLLRESEGLMADLHELGPGTVALYTLVSDQHYWVIFLTPDVQVARGYPISAIDLSLKVLQFRQILQAPASPRVLPTRDHWPRSCIRYSWPRW